MDYLWRLLGHALQRSFVRTDIYSAVVAVLAPAIYFLLGQPVPENVTLYTSLLVAGLAGAILVLRFVGAPYQIWREDSETIAALRIEIESPTLEAQRVIRTKLAGERVDLAGRVAEMAEAIQAARSGAACIKIIEEHRVLFVKFSYDPEIRASWKSFENAAFFYGAGFPDPRKIAGNAVKAEELMETHRRTALPALDRATSDLLCTLLDQPKLRG